MFRDLKNIVCPFAILVLLSCFFSCKKEEHPGVPTILKGHVADTIRGISISGYEIVLTKKVGQTCANWECMTDFEPVASAITDSSGDYSITFNHKLKPGQEYCYEEQYYGIPYYHEGSYVSGPIVPGKTTIENIFAWRPVKLIINVDILNNNNPPLNVVCRFNSDITLNAAESVGDKNTRKTFAFDTRPNSDVNLHFWFDIGTSSLFVRHQKIVPLHTNLNDVTTMDVVVDCSTF